MRIDFSQTRRSCVARPAAGRRRCGEDADRSAAQRDAAFSGEQTLSDYIKSGGKLDDRVFAALQVKNEHIESATNGKTSFEGADESTKRALRIDAFLVGATIDKLGKTKAIADADEAASLKKYGKSLDALTKFIPLWVKVAIAVALGLGTMIGWKRIVVTVGERIGKSHLTYAEGASADIFGLPVSATHVLSSGVAGTMAANGSGLQGGTLRNIMLAWVLTLPVCVFLGSMLFAGGLLIVAQLGIH